MASCPCLAPREIARPPGKSLCSSDGPLRRLR